MSQRSLTTTNQTEPTGQYGQQPQQQMSQHRPRGQYQFSQQQSQQTGQQWVQRQQGGGQLPQEYRQSLQSISQAIQVCGWCADQCIKSGNQNMIECIRMCEDVVEVGEALLAIAPRSSQFTGDLARTFQQAAQTCAQECSRHQDSHCQECASVLPQAAQSAQQLSSMGTQQSSGQQFSQ